MSGIVKSIFGYQDAPAPDPAIGKAAEANAAISGRMQDLAEKQYADQSATTSEFLPLLKDQISKANAAQALSTQQSAQQWGDYMKTWQPGEQQLASRTLDLASPGRVDQAGARAAADATTQFDRARGDTTAQLNASGASPEKIAALEAAGRLNEAKGVAGATSAARTAQEGQGIALLDNAARFGRNMTSTGIASATLAGQQGNGVAGGVGAVQNAIAAPAQAAAPLLSGAVGANNSAGSLFNTSWNQASASAQQNNALTGDIIGAGAKIAGMFLSSAKKKHMGPKVKGAVAAVEKSPAKHWSYRPGLGDGSTKPRMGPTAESLHKAAPSVSDGKQVDGIALHGLHHAAIGELAARVKKLEGSKQGLSAARKGD
jgi:hypothetical protein